MGARSRRVYLPGHSIHPGPAAVGSPAWGLDGSRGTRRAPAPPDDLFADFSREKTAAKREGASAEDAHATAFRRSDYAARFRRHILTSADSGNALRALVEESKTRDVYVMCMCPYRTPGEACHTYLLLALAREMDASVQILPEPPPKARA